MIWLGILIVVMVATILCAIHIDENFGFLFFAWGAGALILSLFIYDSLTQAYKYELNDPIKYEVTEQEAKIYYNEIKNEEKVIIKNGNVIIKADIYDVDVNPSTNNYVEYYNLTKFKKTKYYWSAFPGNRDYLVFHFTDEIKEEK